MNQARVEIITDTDEQQLQVKINNWLELMFENIDKEHNYFQIHSFTNISNAPCEYTILIAYEKEIPDKEEN